MSTKVKVGLTIVPAMVVSLLPESCMLAGINPAQQRIAAVFVFAVASWILEPIPIFATSVAIIGLLLALVSDTAPLLWRLDPDLCLSSTALLGSFGSRILILFLGGFFLALAASRYRLDVVLAKVLLRPFGRKPSTVVLGLMIITALFSMFMSNTATTAMMLAVLAPVLSALPEKDPGRVGATLAIPLAANIGGIGTPIGTPPNAVALGVLGKDAPNFVQWMAFGVPFAVVLLFLAWLLVLAFHKPEAEQLEVSFEARLMRGPRPMTAYCTCLATVLLWLTGPLHGVNSYAVAMVPIVVFTASGIVSAKDLRGLGWDILWLVAGGVALGMALSQSGLTAVLIEAIPFAQIPLFALIALVCMVTAIMATFMSNTATANLMLPLVATLGVSLADKLSSLGGATSLVITATIAASMGMALPISTPPNAIAYGSGLIDTKQMATIGSAVTLLGLLMLIPLLAIFRIIGGT